MYVILDAGLYLTLSGVPLQTDHILISDIGLSDDTALICWNREISFGLLRWHHKFRVESAIHRNNDIVGWQSKTVISGGRQGLLLKRMSGISATEGKLSCRRNVESLSMELSVAVHYPSEQEHIKGRSLQLCRTAFETLLIGFAHIWGRGNTH